MIKFFASLFFLMIVINNSDGVLNFGWCNQTTAAARDQNLRKKITPSNVKYEDANCFFEVHTAKCYAHEKIGAEYKFVKQNAADICAKYGGYMLAFLTDDEGFKILPNGGTNRTIALGLTKISADNYTWDNKIDPWWKLPKVDWTAHDLKPDDHAFTIVYQGQKLNYHSYKIDEKTPFEIDVVCEERPDYAAPPVVAVDESKCEAAGGGSGGPGTGGGPGPGTGGTGAGGGAGGSGSSNIKIISSKQVAMIVMMKLIFMIMKMQ